MSLPAEAEKLLAAAPEDYVEERKRVARELRDAGRGTDADAVAALRKPSAVVLAVNRAARDRPKSARGAADAAGRLARAQLSGDAGAFRREAEALERSLDELADVAVAQLSREKPANDAMRRRVADLLRSAVGDESAREALAGGTLVEEGGASGFDAFASVSVTAKPTRRSTRERAQPRDTAAEERREQARALKKDLAQAKDALRAAERAVRTATSERDRAAKAVEAAERKLEQLERG
jgi:hypothetical protein